MGRHSETGSFLYALYTISLCVVAGSIAIMLVSEAVRIIIEALGYYPHTPEIVHRAVSHAKARVTAPVVPHRPAARKLPVTLTRTYSVQPGDNLWDISLRFFRTGLDWRELAGTNHLRSPWLIYPRERLVIP